MKKHGVGGLCKATTMTYLRTPPRLLSRSVKAPSVHETPSKCGHSEQSPSTGPADALGTGCERASIRKSAQTLHAAIYLHLLSRVALKMVSVWASCASSAAFARARRGRRFVRVLNLGNRTGRGCVAGMNEAWSG